MHMYISKRTHKKKYVIQSNMQNAKIASITLLLSQEKL